MSVFKDFMSKVPYCWLSAGLIGANIYMLMTCSECLPLNQSFDLNQKQLYEQIVRERKALAIQGFVLGLIISALYLYFMGLSINPLANGCIYAGLTLIVQTIYYLLSPKSTYMVEHLSEDQLNLYAESNRTMQLRWITGTLLGFLGLALVPWILKFLPRKS
jgi:hypothetical protein